MTTALTIALLGQHDMAVLVPLLTDLVFDHSGERPHFQHQGDRAEWSHIIAEDMTPIVDPVFWRALYALLDQTFGAVAQHASITLYNAINPAMSMHVRRDGEFEIFHSWLIETPIQKERYE